MPVQSLIHLRRVAAQVVHLPPMRCKLLVYTCARYPEKITYGIMRYSARYPRDNDEIYNDGPSAQPRVSIIFNAKGDGLYRPKVGRYRRTLCIRAVVAYY
jgi:hypothetical protein